MGLASLHALLMAVLMWRAPESRGANRAMAALLVVVVLTITPYTLGYAGCYDAWPWLTFAPFSWQLALGPLLWIYVHQIVIGGPPKGWRWHLVPAAMQGAYYTVMFLQPTDVKFAWYLGGHARIVSPLLWAAVCLSVTAYWLPAWGVAVGRDGTAVAQEPDRADALRWVRAILVLIGVVIACGVGFGLWHLWIRPLSYFDAFGLYLAFAGLAYALGIAGWRQTHGRTGKRVTESRREQRPRTSSPPDDWRARGRQWAEQMEAAGWFREPDLTLSTLARRLGTNTAYLSRAFNDGLGESFTMVVNRLRVAAACRALEEGGSVLAIALDVGFGSKATFNRVFRQCLGTTPSTWREDARARLKGEKYAANGEIETI